MSPRLVRASAARPGLKVSVIAGAVAAVVAVTAGLVFIARRQATWTARATLVVVPGPAVARDALAGYFETLSRGQVVATVAEILRQERFASTARTDLEQQNIDSRDLRLSAEVVPQTAVIRIRATAPRRELAEGLIERTVLAAQPAVESAINPFTVNTVTVPGGTARRQGPSGVVFYAALVIAAIAAGVAVQQVVHHLSTLMSGGGAGVESDGSAHQTPVRAAEAGGFTRPSR